MKKFIFLAILLIQFFHQQVVGTPPPPPPAIPANHFLMVIQWTKAFCKDDLDQKKVNKCPTNYERVLANKFYIHGLWPKPASIRLNSAPFNFQVLVTLAQKDKTRLTTNWPSAESAGSPGGEGAIMLNSQKFWAHEWEDHGQYQTMNQRDYFNFVLDRYDELSNIHKDVVTKFRSKSKVEVRVPDIVQHILSKHRVTVSISCLPYDDTPGKKMLYEIYFNLTLSGQLQNVTNQRNLHEDPCPANAVFLKNCFLL